MTSELHLDRPLVTVFGNHDALDIALNDELDRRGRMTHLITTPMGWLASVTHAVVRLNTEAGEQALRDLASRDVPLSHVVAVCETLDDDAWARFDALCRQCGEHHDVSLIWHSPLELTVSDAHDPRISGAVLDPAQLAVTIADEVSEQESRESAPAFASLNYEPLP